MTTTKPRINFTADKETAWALKTLAKRDRVPVSAKVSQLITRALELEEDLILGEIAEKRLQMKGKIYTHHEAFWKGKV